VAAVKGEYYAGKLEEMLKKATPGVIRYSISFTEDIPELLSC
jgi:hypothetical protein